MRRERARFLSGNASEATASRHGNEPAFEVVTGLIHICGDAAHGDGCGDSHVWRFSEQVVPPGSRNGLLLRRPIRVSYQPLVVDRCFQVDAEVTGEEQCVRKHIGQLGAEVAFDLVPGPALGPSLAGTHQERLGQLSDLFMKLEDEPVIVAFDPVPGSVDPGNGLDFAAELTQVHTARVATPSLPAECGVVLSCAPGRRWRLWSLSPLLSAAGAAGCALPACGTGVAVAGWAVCSKLA